MASKVPLPPPGFDELPVEEQIAYVGSLWDRIAANPEDVPVPDWHKRVIAERLAMESDPARPWEETIDELRTKLKERRER